MKLLQELMRRNVIRMAGPYLVGAFDRAPDAIDRHIDEVTGWKRSPPGLRDSPAFKRTQELHGVPAYWRTQCLPPQCRPVGDTDHECDPVQ